jgi:hypothetical protein
MSRTFYHATDCVFEKFDPARQGTKGASNGHLGVWVATVREGCEMFGDVLMTLSVPEASAYPMDLSDIYDMHVKASRMDDDEAAAYYEDFAADLMAAGYNVIDINERGAVCHCILLDFDNIVIESCEVLEKASPSTWGKP